MRKEDLIQDLSFLGCRYARILSRQVTREDVENLKKRYHYIHIYSFDKKELPGFDVRIQKTPIFDLSEDLEKIFQKFNDTCKKHIRRGERNSDLKLVADDNNFSESYALYKKAKSHEGVRPDIQREFTNCLLFNAYFRGKIIVTMSFYDNGEIIRAKHIGSLRKEMDGMSEKIIAHATRGLNWEAIKWGKAHGRKIFDLAGITDVSSMAGIKEFKMSFGGNITDIYICRHVTPVFHLIKKAVNLLGSNIH